MGPLENVIKKENMLPEAEDRESGNVGSGRPVVMSATSGASCHRCPVGSSTKRAVDLFYLVSVFTSQSRYYTQMSQPFELCCPVTSHMWLVVTWNVASPS